MALSPQTKLNVRRVAVITFSYVLIGLMITFYNDALLRSPYVSGLSDTYHLQTALLVHLLMGIIAGILGGSVLVAVNGRLFRKRSFSFAMVTTAIAYILVFVFVSTVLSTVTARTQLGIDSTYSEVVSLTLDLILSPISITYFLLWGFITLFTLFLLQVNDKFGPGILLKFMLGQYHQPKEEERIFMFVDMRSSTTIAEKIGNTRYFNLLRDLFSDITDTILNHEGEIYQYVGDEIVISWPISKGIHNANCLHCFLQIQKKLVQLTGRYEKKYGLMPEFKAGLHFGKVMAGEIGSIKKDIIFSGDVLNTTARIQEQCNRFKVDFIASRDILDLVKDQSRFILVSLGNINLRGKENDRELYSIQFN